MGLKKGRRKRFDLEGDASRGVLRESAANAWHHAVVGFHFLRWLKSHLPLAAPS